MTSSTPEDRISPSPPRVLLVEDNAVIAMNTEALLLDLGVAQVRTAATVADALALVEDMRFDLAILDFQLGEAEDSLPVAERLAASGVRFIFATGLGEEIRLPAGFAETPVLRKPYGFDDLERILCAG